MNGCRWIVLFAALCAASAATAGNFVLAERGKPAGCAIVIEADADECVRYAADELRRFVCETTGVELPVATNGAAEGRAVVLQVEGWGTGNGEQGTGAAFPTVQRSNDSAVQRHCPDAFHLHVEGERLRITGDGARGVLYGVYEVLERFAGCRWYSSWHSVIPKRDRIELPDVFDDVQTPAFEMREPFWFDVRRHADFAARLRSNSFKWGTVKPQYGGDDFRFGGGLPSAHSFGVLLPPERYFAEHPEYYCMVDGVRGTNGQPRGITWQPCLSNPDVLRIVTSNVLERIRTDPGARFYGVSQQDHGCVCECPDCKAVNEAEESQAGTLFRFVNAVAEAVEKEFPEAVIETLAYMWSRKPPKLTRLRHNVTVCLCTSGCDAALPLGESRWKQSTGFRRDIVEWGRQTDRLYVWDYVTDFAYYTIPFPNVRSLQGNLRFFRDNHVRFMFSQGDNTGSHADFAELKTWLISKWMWNPDLPMEPLLDDFFAGYYGAAAPHVREWFETIHRLQFKHSASGENPLLYYDGPDNPAIPDDALDRGVELWRQAEETVKEDSALAYNVRMSKLSFDCMRLWRLVKRTNVDKSGAEVRALARSIAACLDETKTIRLSESPRKSAELEREIRDLAKNGGSAR